MKAMVWVGRIVSALPVLMVLLSGVGKLMKPEPSKPLVVELNRLGYDESLVLGLGITELVCALIYVIPRTCVLGAILLTGYFGAAVAAHLRVGDPIYLPIIGGVLVWVGLFLRDARVRALIPLRS